MNNNRVMAASLTEYLNTLPPSPVPTESAPIAFAENTAFHQALTDFFRGNSKNVFKRVRTIRALTFAFDQEQRLGNVTLRFSFWKKTAYMTDSGSLVVPLSLVMRKRRTRIIKILFHEFAHLHLRQHPDYATLLAVDQEFLRCFGRHEHVVALSPIERYATELSCVYLESAAKLLPQMHATELEIEAKTERDKLQQAYFGATPYLQR